jgi:hypothetical protein
MIEKRNYTLKIRCLDSKNYADMQKSVAGFLHWSQPKLRESGFERETLHIALAY